MKNILKNCNDSRILINADTAISEILLIMNHKTIEGDFTILENIFDILYYYIKNLYDPNGKNTLLIQKIMSANLYFIIDAIKIILRLNLDLCIDCKRVVLRVFFSNFHHYLDFDNNG